MCEPISATTLAIIGGVAAIGAAGVSAYGQYQTGKAQKAASDYQAQIEQKNAAIAQQNADMEREVGREQERRQRLKTAQIIGQQKTALAANGLEINSGTATDLQADSAMLGEMDALMIRYDSERRAINYENQSSNLLAQSELTTMAGKNAFKSAKYGAASTLLGGVGKAAGKWSGYGGGSGSSGLTSGAKTTTEYGYLGSLGGMV